jgi:acyl dehydratase
MLIVSRPIDLADYVGQKLGTSDWVAVDQVMIDAFAEVTGDKNWFHIDVERARRDLPGGHTVAHGYLTLSLMARMSSSIYEIRQRTRGVNYGLNRLRFTQPVHSGSRIRLHETLLAAEAITGGARLTFEWTVEIETQSRPALVAEAVLLAFG